jgi:hypothetical protein
MELELSIRSVDPNVRIDIPSGKIAEGVFIEQSLTLKEIANPPVDYILFIAENILLPVTSTLIANYLLKYLDKRKDKPITINNQTVQINAKNIEQQINIIINQSKKENDENMDSFSNGD